LLFLIQINTATACIIGVLCSTKINVNVPDAYKASVDLMLSVADDTLNNIKDIADEIGKKNIKRVESLVLKSIKESEKVFLEIEGQISKDVENILSSADDKYRLSMKETFNQINKERAEALVDIRYTIGFIDEKIENKINRIILLVMKSLSEISKFEPKNVHKNLIEPTILEIKNIENSFFKHSKNLINHAACRSEATLKKVDDVLKKRIGQFLFSRNPELICNKCSKGFGRWVKFDKDQCHVCCKKPLVGLVDNLGKPLSRHDIKFYRFKVCRSLSELNETSPVQRIIDTYSELHQFTMQVYCESNIINATSTEQPMLNTMKYDGIKWRDKYNMWVKYRK
jgi:hypothetical protein